MLCVLIVTFRSILYCYAPIGTSPALQKAFIWNLTMVDRLSFLGNMLEEWDDDGTKLGRDYLLYAILSKVL